MHGIILRGLKQFVVENYDHETWTLICEEAGVDRTLFVPVTEYPDEIVFDIVGAAAEISGEDPEDLLFAYGRFVVPTLVETYGVHVPGDWEGLDLVVNVERYIHEALRRKSTGDFEPPEIGAERLDDDRIVVTYGSDRGLCTVAKGILQGVADHYGETYEIEERRCMHEGDPECEIEVTRTAVAAAD